MSGPLQVPDLVRALSLGLHQTDDPEAWDKTKIHASDLGASSEAIGDPTQRWCARALQLRFQETDGKQPSDGERLMWQQGKNLEEQMVALWNVGLELMNEGWTIAVQHRNVSDNLPGEMVGALDVRATGPNGEKVVIDVKTKRGGAFQYLDRPKASNVIQIQAYMMADDADLGILFYVDREGQNFAKQFEVGRNDDAVLRAYMDVHRMKYATAPEPLVVPAWHKPKETKTKGWSVTAKLPWQCGWCPFFEKACPGALPEQAVDKVVGHIEVIRATELEGYAWQGSIKRHSDGDNISLFFPREGFEDVAKLVAQAMKLGGALHPRWYTGKGEGPYQPADQDSALAARSWGANPSPADTTEGP